MHDWHERVITEIEATDIEPVATRLTTEQRTSLERYLDSSADVVQRHHRQAKIRATMVSVVQHTLLVGTPLLLIGCLLASLLGTATSVPVGVTAIMCSGIALVLIAILTAVVIPKKVDAIDLLENSTEHYLPTIHHEANGDEVTVSLADTHRAYASKTFTANEEAAALEYQVELEWILNEIKESRAQAFIQRQLAYVHVKPVAELEAATETTALQSLLAQHREPLKLT